MIAQDVEVLRAACCVAAMDGEVDVKEHALLQVLAKRIGVGAMSLDAMISRAKTDPKFFEQQFRILSADPEAALRTLLAVAAADGKLTMEERVVLHYFADKLGMPNQRFDEIFAEAEEKLGGTRE